MLNFLTKSVHHAVDALHFDEHHIPHPHLHSQVKHHDEHGRWHRSSSLESQEDKEEAARRRRKEEEQRRERERREQELKYVHEHKNSIAGDTPLHIIEANWMRSWWNHVVNEGPHPGPICNWNLLELSVDTLHKHGYLPKPALRYEHDYLGVTEKVWMFLLKSYRGGPSITSWELNIEDAKVHDFKGDLPHDDKRHLLEEIEQVKKNELPGKSEPWCIIDAVWLKKWRKYVKQGGPHPGPVANFQLLDHGGLDEPPKSYLLAGTHYRGVSPEVWRIFIKRYGGGPPILRQQLDIYGLRPGETKTGTKESTMTKQVHMLLNSDDEVDEDEIEIVRDELMIHSVTPAAWQQTQQPAAWQQTQQQIPALPMDQIAESPKVIDSSPSATDCSPKRQPSFFSTVQRISNDRAVAREAERSPKGRLSPKIDDEAARNVAIARWACVRLRSIGELDTVKSTTAQESPRRKQTQVYV